MTEPRALGPNRRARPREPGSLLHAADAQHPHYCSTPSGIRPLPLCKISDDSWLRSQRSSWLGGRHRRHGIAGRLPSFACRPATRGHQCSWRTLEQAGRARVLHGADDGDGRLVPLYRGTSDLLRYRGAPSPDARGVLCPVRKRDRSENWVRCPPRTDGPCGWLAAPRRRSSPVSAAG